MNNVAFSRHCGLHQLLSHQEGVLDTGEKMGVVAGDRGVNMVKTGGEGLGDELVLTQDSVGKQTSQFCRTPPTPP